MAELIRYEVDGNVATITLNRPEKANAINWEMVNQLDDAWKRAMADDEVRCIILTGEGKAFSAGDDLQQAWSGDQFDQLMQRFKERPEEPESMVQFELAKPLIGAINGHCFGGALELVLWADILIASENAKFGANFVEYGIMGGATTFWRLPRLVGPSTASLLLLTGERIDAKEAERIGLVSRVVPREELMPTAKAMAQRVASFNPLAVRYTRQGLRTAIGATLPGQRETISFANRALAALFKGETLDAEPAG